MTSLPSNLTVPVNALPEVVPYDTNGAIIYILVVIVWYALGFSLILLDDLNPQAGRIESSKYVSVYQAVTDLHEHQLRNDLLMELKDKERRMKLWQIYYGTTGGPLADAAVKKDHEAVEGITKQLEELTEQRRALRNTLNYTSVDQPDVLNSVVDSDTESLPSDSTVHGANEPIYLLS